MGRTACPTRFEVEQGSTLLEREQLGPKTWAVGSVWSSLADCKRGVADIGMWLLPVEDRLTGKWERTGE
jgi:hypothetical protein